MKVLHLTNNYPTVNYPIFGIFVKEQIESLKPLNIESDVLFINGRENGKLEYLKSIVRIRQFLKLHQYDIIHCHHALSALCLIVAGAVKNNKVIVSFQNDPENEFGLFVYQFIKRRISQSIFKNNSRLILDDSCSYLANGVNTSFFRPLVKAECCKTLGLDPSKIYILFVSSNYIRPQKRYDRFKEVMKLLKTYYQWEDIEALTLINTKRDLVPYYFNAASLHLLTSDFEGSPNSVKESMSCNTPVVSTPVGNVEELVTGAQNCFVSNSFDAHDLAFLCDKALKTKGNPRDLILQKKLDIDSVALKLQGIYLKVKATF